MQLNNLSLNKERRNAFKPVIDYIICNNCTTCIDLCKYKAIYIDSVDGYVKMDYAKCKECGICVKVCPYGAIKYYRKK
uniref:4Fe-4S dicluster domain-containing protein n=1 Tax=Ignisphaera aggregans TaxID=334771 RepID=A0A7J3JSJ1_9CREN